LQNKYDYSLDLKSLPYESAGWWKIVLASTCKSNGREGESPSSIGPERKSVFFIDLSRNPDAEECVSVQQSPKYSVTEFMAIWGDLNTER